MDLEKLKFHLGELCWLCGDPDIKLFFMNRGVPKEDLDSFSQAAGKMVQSFYLSKCKVGRVPTL